MEPKELESSHTDSKEAKERFKKEPKGKLNRKKE